MYTVWFKSENETCRVDAESLIVARLAWDTLSGGFQMISARP